ncbi:proton-conducting transporter membrane subunit [Saliniramus sp.]|uniref:proton-conducting transporter transmembrane domain-containing protein n=1 Tax=Saliniramus sp. TaxID=2986772 RepID=UPI002B94ACC4|nr:proton-conducting transporter membrane subunit [Saliniramus sp.]HMB09233.1 proton-conducting transporter membrane subunit [Saliniramus sp.]
MSSSPSLSMLAPIFILLIAGYAAFYPGRRPGGLPLLTERVAIAAMVAAVAGGLQLVFAGQQTFAFGSDALMIAFRLDALSATMTILVAFIGWIVVRYARTYLDGEQREGAFHGWMALTLASVLLLVQSGSLVTLVLAFVAIGFGLRQLLLFYSERPEAQRAAAKFTLVWAGGDVALVLASILLFIAFGTTDIASIAAQAEEGAGFAMHAAIALLVLTAALKTAAFPLHGWLTEVMEAPTPVSALLHAGIINAGGFLLIRMADLIQTSTAAMAALLMLGGFTALFAAAVMLTQSAIKTALAWSTIAQMGFMLLQCGLGLWTLALLHIVAHSLYKAHAFLASGGAVKAVAEIRRPGPVAVPGLGAVLRAFALALVLYALVATFFGFVFGSKSAQALSLGAILIFGVAYLVAQGMADAAPRELTRRTVMASFAATLAYFGFHLVADLVWGAHLPAAPVPGPLEWGLIVLMLFSFGLIAVAQALFPLWAHHPAAAGLRVHLANGLYLNAVLDRMIGGFTTPKSR